MKTYVSTALIEPIPRSELVSRMADPVTGQEVAAISRATLNRFSEEIGLPAQMGGVILWDIATNAPYFAVHDPSPTLSRREAQKTQGLRYDTLEELADLARADVAPYYLGRLSTHLVISLNRVLSAGQLQLGV